MQYEQIRLKNGLDVLFIDSPGGQAASLQIWFRAGSALEQAKDYGIAHFLEHMFFKGTKKRPGTKIALDAEAYGGERGDLYVVVDVRDHEIFERDGFDVYCTVPIGFSQAALGSEIEVPTINGKVAMKIPAGTQSGKKMRLKGKGIQRLGGHGQGDQIISIHVETPTKLSPEQRELFERLADLEESSSPMSRSFFDKVKDLFQ